MTERVACGLPAVLGPRDAVAPVSRPSNHAPRRSVQRRSRALVALAALLTLAACGAGILGAGIAGSRRSGAGTAQVTLTVSPAAGPIVLLPGDVVLRTAVLRGKRVPTDASAELRLVWEDGATRTEDVQLLGRVDSGSSETVITFALATANLAAQAGSPRARDLDAELVLLARRTGVADEVLARTAFRLLRQPLLTLVPNRSDLGISLVPVSGGELELVVEDLPTTDVRDLSVLIVTADPNPPPGSNPNDPPVIRSPGINLRTEAVPGQPTRTRIFCTAPPATVANAAFVQVRHTLAGSSNAIADVYYRPELNAVVPRRASTAGGDLLTLTGSALIPFDFSVTPPRPDIALIQLTILQGGRSSIVPAADLRPALSTLNSIVFVAPPAPAGRAGAATVRLETSLPLLVATDGAELLAYGAADADLSPRGVGLERDAVAAAFGALELAAPDAPLSAAVLYPDTVGVPFVQVFAAQGNGVFRAQGVEILAGDRADADQRNPADLVWSEFHGDALADLFVLNRGTTNAAHVVLRGSAEPGEPLRFSNVAFRGAGLPASAIGASFDGNGLGDVLVAGGSQAERTSVVARALATGGFQIGTLFSAPIGTLECATVDDLDGDGAEDLAFASGGLTARVLLAFGDGAGAFADRLTIDLSAVTGASFASFVGIHAVGPGPNRALALVLRDTSGASPHQLLVLTPDAPRSWAGPRTAIPLGSGPPSTSLAADLDGDQLAELLVARELSGVSLFQWQGAGFVELAGAVAMSAVDTGIVREMQLGRAVGGAVPRDAVFVLHRTQDLRPDPARITTLLVGPGPSLEDARAERLLRLPARALALTDRDGGAAIAFDDELAWLRNDGVGGLTESGSIGVAGLLEGTIARCPVAAAAPARVAFLSLDGRVGLADDGASQALYSATPLFDGAGTVRAESRLVVADLDRDGRDDLVVVLVVDRGTPSTERSLLLLSGRDPLIDPFPFALPAAAARTPLGFEALDLAIGDFAPGDPGGNLEVVLSAPRSDAARGLHFFRREAGATPEEARLVESVVEATDPRVAANFDPRLVRVADLDGDGFDDLLVASGSLDQLRVYRQAGASTRTTTRPAEVDPLVFAPTSDLVLPTGIPLAMHLADLDGDRGADLVVHVRRRNDPTQHAVAVALTDALAGFLRSFEIPLVDVVGSGPDLATRLGDLNGDGLVDLALAWSGDGAMQPSLVRVLFGTHR